MLLAALLGVLCSGAVVIWATGALAAPSVKRQPPTPSFTQTPPDPSNTATSTFAWTDSQVGVSYQCSKEAGSFQPCSSPLTYNVATTSSGQHQFAVRAVDAAGTISDAATYKWKVPAGTPANFTISGNAPQQLYPGAPASALNLTLTNPNSGNLTVTNLGLSVRSVSAPNATASRPCTPSDFGVTGYGGSSFTLPPGTKTLSQLGIPSTQWPSLRMLNRADNPAGSGTGNQDGCKGATVALSYSGSAQS
jgi:hypothetical protein